MGLSAPPPYQCLLSMSDAAAVAAVAAAAAGVQSTNLDGAVDGSRVGLWGVSYGGAHVLVTAAKFGDSIKAVIANVSGSGLVSAQQECPCQWFWHWSSSKRVSQQMCPASKCAEVLRARQQSMRESQFDQLHSA